jgi:hypothetical protein
MDFSEMENNVFHVLQTARLAKILVDVVLVILTTFLLTANVSFLQPHHQNVIPTMVISW